MQPFDIDGYWFPSDAPYDRIPGSLEFDPVEGLTLTLMGRFKSYTKMASDSERRLDIDTIFGQTVDGAEITLTECSIGRYSIPSEYDYEGRSVTRYHPDYCYAGTHSDGGPEFHSITMLLTNFDEWIHMTDVEDLSFDLTDETKINFSYSDPHQRSHLVNDQEDDYRVTFRFDPSKEFESIRRGIIRPFQFFISFGLRAPVFPIRIHGVTEVNNGRPFAERLPGGRDVDAFFVAGTSVVYPEPRVRLKPAGRTHPMWTLAFIEDEIDTILQNWYAKYQKHQPLFDLFFNSMYYDDGEYPSVTVLNLTRALEAYHRESDKYENTYIDKDEYSDYQTVLEDTIPSDFPDQFADHLKGGTFKYANRVSLRKRLKDIIEDNKEVLRYRLDEELHSEEMATEIKDIRNDLTHLSDEDISEFNVEGTILYKLRALIETAIADEVGFNPEIFPFYHKRSEDDD